MMKGVAMFKHIEIVAIFLWMGVLCCYGQTDSVATRIIDPNEIRDRYVVESMDSITAERVEEQIILQQFVESLAEVNASCPMKMENIGNAILDSMTFEYPQVIYQLSMLSKDYQERPSEIVKEEANKMFPMYADNMRVESISINKGYFQYDYTVIEDKTLNIKTLKKSEWAIKSNLKNTMLAENSDMYLLITGSALLHYGFIFRFASNAKKKHLDVVFSPDEMQEIERRRLQR